MRSKAIAGRIAALATAVVMLQLLPCPPAAAGEAEGGGDQPRRLVARALRGPFSDLARSRLDERDNTCVQTYADLGPAAPAGFRAMSLQTEPRQPPRLLLAVTTTVGRFATEVPLPAGQALPETGAFAFEMEGSSLIVGLGVGWTSTRVEMTACSHYAMVCQLVAADGVPHCSGPRLIARAEGCAGAAAPDVPRGLPAATPTIERTEAGAFSVGGRPIALSSERLSALEPSPLSQQLTLVRGVDFSQVPGVSGIGIAHRRRPHEYWLEIETARGSYFGRKPIGRARPGHDLGYGRHQVLGGTTLFSWSSGTGIIDPPDSSYEPCQHQFVACTMGTGGPRCSDVVTIARARRCALDTMSELAAEVPAARLLADGQTFEIGGKRYVLAGRPVDVP